MLLCPWDSPGKNTGVGCHFLLQGLFPTQVLNPGLLHCRQTLYHLSHQVCAVNPMTDVHILKKKKKSRTQKHREDHNEKEQGKNWNEHLQTKEYQRLLTSTRSYERSMGCLLSQSLQKKATLQTTWVLTSGHLYCEDSLIAQLVKYLPAMQETPVQFLCWEDLLEKE